MAKETLCWGCANYAHCSWSKGVPVEGWDATPTIINDASGGVMHSFCVHSCPQFKGDPKQMVCVRDIAAIINKSRRTVFRYLTTKRTRLYLRELLKEKGYILHICKEIYNDCGESARTYYLEKIRDCEV